MIETSHLETTARAYDGVAALYAEFVRDSLDGLPLDRAMLAAFAEVVRGSGAVADLGCGPGYLTAHLQELGVASFGIDLSPAMVELAVAAWPQLRFEVGSMAALALADGELGGVVSWYSIIHAPPQVVPGYLAEFSRVLAPDGHLLLGFFAADGDAVVEFDHRVTPARRWPVDVLAGMAGEHGFVEVARMLRAPVEGERFRHGRLLMRKA